MSLLTNDPNQTEELLEACVASRRNRINFWQEGGTTR
jgi:hypothetical protein